jgi:transglutaminase-like putative cysteine protease
MTILSVRHVTTYLYRKPVAFGEHRMMFRPRDSYDQRLVAPSLLITPEPVSEMVAFSGLPGRAVCTRRLAAAN